jgi:monofunctional biosynthetic peptidoglycan transglycosylase
MTRRRARRSFASRLRRAALALLLVVALAPALPIAALRFVPPPGSALMLQRWSEAQGAGRSFRLRYQWVPLRRIAPALRAAVVTSEDQRFHTHHGFDLESLRDALLDWAGGKKLRGASTISQQVAKNLFLWPGRSLVRKALEAWLTLWVELLWSKQRILEVYLNVVELGDGVFGAEAASQRYFGRSAASLGAEESALLAAVLPSPRRSSVTSPSSSVRERQQWILAQIAPRPAPPPAPVVEPAPPAFPGTPAPIQPPAAVEAPPAAVETPPPFEVPPSFEPPAAVDPPPAPAEPPAAGPFEAPPPEPPSGEAPPAAPPATEAPTPPRPPPAS